MLVFRVCAPCAETKSGRSEFVFRPVPCKRMKRNVWRAIRTHTGLSSSRSHGITPMGRTGGCAPEKMGRGGKGRKPVGSSKRVGSGRNKGKLPLNARYFETEKGLKRKKTPKKGRKLGMQDTEGGRSVPPFPQSYFPKKTYASLDESQTWGKTKRTIFSGT